MASIPVTVFTPTYNRAHTLRRVFESLLLQPSTAFEWLVVDDGSTDDTLALLDELSKSSPFPVRVIRQPNGGKHRAHNTAVKVARGELTVILDSDDELAPDALTAIIGGWNAIPPVERKCFAGILGHCASTQSSIVGTRFGAKYIDGNQFELAASGVIVGEKLPCYRTDVLREFPFPERLGCNAHIPEGTIWTKISTKYKVRCIDQVVRIYHRDCSDPIALMNSYKRPDLNAWGSMQSFLVVLNMSTVYWPRFFLIFTKAAVNCTRYSLHSKSGWLSPFNRLDGLIPRLLWAVGFPLGLAVWVIDRIRHSSQLRP